MGRISPGISFFLFDQKKMVFSYKMIKLAPSALAGVGLSLDPEGKIMALSLHN